MAAIWAAVLNLPTVATATLLRLPSCAIHSRRAEMVISRPMMMMAQMAQVRSRRTRRMRATATMSLSATGSRKAPKSEVCFHLRAR